MKKKEKEKRKENENASEEKRKKKKWLQIYLTKKILKAVMSEDQKISISTKKKSF